MTATKKSSKPRQRSRRAILDSERLRVWAAAAGRCTFCNGFVIENELLGEPVLIGEMAHIVGRGTESPRGASDLDDDERRAAANLVLACRNCHKPVDDGGAVGRYTVKEIVKRKQEHEERIRALTDIGADRSAFIVRIVGVIRGVAPELTRQTVLTAATSAGLYPRRLPGSHWEDVDLDLRLLGDFTQRLDFEKCVPLLKELTDRLHDGVRRADVRCVAVFAFARIPILVAFGALLDDKVPALIFQRQRTDDVNAWVWPQQGDAPHTFVHELKREGTNPDRVALMICMSGEIDESELPSDIDESYSVYRLGPDAAFVGPSLVQSPSVLINFENALRSFLAHIEQAHGKVDSISLFPAVPLSAAVTIGRVPMPDISPAWVVFDRDDEGRFLEALEVRK